MMEELATYSLKEKITEPARKLFYYLGKWIYLIDALDDYEKDIKEKNYNPPYGEKPTVKELFEIYGKDLSFTFSEIFASMKSSLSECKFYFNHDLIDNIILRGIPSVTLKILKKEREKDE